MSAYDGGCRAYFDAIEGKNREIAATIRDLVFGVWPDAEETIKWSVPTYLVNKQNTVYIENEKAYVKLGFFKGGSLDDPAGILDGTGKSMRHIKFRDPEAVESDDVCALVEEAGDLAKENQRVLDVLL